ncbi:hypothetical protein ACN4EE_13585 [Geminocystis sp. CENA526]
MAINFQPLSKFFFDIVSLNCDRAYRVMLTGYGFDRLVGGVRSNFLR